MRNSVKLKQIVVMTTVVLMMIIGGRSLAAAQKAPGLGMGFRGGAFGVPNRLVDYFIYEHPEIRGESYSFEIRSYGVKGPKSLFVGLYSLEYSKMSGEGPWRDEQEHRRLDGRGEITQLTLTAAIIMNIFPSSPVHPYFGLGLGVGKISIWYEGTYTDELGTEITDRYDEDRFIPVLHVPVGIRLNFKNRVDVRFEGGFRNGFYLGAGLTFNF
jgi:hypothetical protein